MKNRNDIIVTTGDLKRDYEVLGPVYFQVSNKGLFGSALGYLKKQYISEIQSMKQKGTMSADRADWGFLYGEWSVGQNDFEAAFFIATEELKKRAAMVGADAVICMRQDIDMDTNGFAYFYLQMYGTAVKFISASSGEYQSAERIGDRRINESIVHTPEMINPLPSDERQKEEQKRLEEQRRKEEEQKRLEERRKEEEQKRLDEERRKEEEQKRLEEQRRKAEEQKRLEEQRKKEEQHRKENAFSPELELKSLKLLLDEGVITQEHYDFKLKQYNDSKRLQS